MGKLFKRDDTPSGYWYASFTDRTGKRVRKCTMVKDKTVANKIMLQWEIEERLHQSGAKDERITAMKDGALSDHIRDYKNHLTTAKRSDQHVDRTIGLIECAASYCQWQRLADITPESVDGYAAHLRKEQHHASRTIASMVVAVRSFCRWCVKQRRLKADPTASVIRPSATTDRRITRRMLMPDEWQWLRRSLQQSTTVRNEQKPAERLLMYWTAIETGLRSNELRQLTRGRIVLDSGDPHVIALASQTKNAELARQFIGDGLAAALRTHKHAGKHLFTPADRLKMAHVLRADIEDARALWEAAEKRSEQELASDFLRSPNADNEVIDFHALRHTCGAWLVMQGVTLPEVQAIMRHSTITLTIDCYGHLAPDAKSRTRNVIGKLME